MAAKEDKPPFQATIVLDAFSMEELEALIEQMQEIVVSQGMSIDGKIGYKTPLTWRRPGAEQRLARISRSTPIDRVLQNA